MQMVKEEGILEELFDKEYKTYCKKVPRIFPSWRNLTKIRTKEIFNLKEAFSTKEKRGLWGWPLFALVLETLQQSIVFGYTDVRQTIIVFMSAIVVFALGFGVLYQTQ
jgi:hypothetical protein